MQLHQLFPEPKLVTPKQVASRLELGKKATEERPYVVTNMVASVDGKATLAGHSGPLGSEADRELFRWLRTQADAVLIGDGTLRAEPYGPLIKSEAQFQERIDSGLEPRPLAAVVSNNLDIPFERKLFHDPDSKIVIYTASDKQLPPYEAQVSVVRFAPNELSPEVIMADLRKNRGIRSVLCEGGPTLNASLLEAGVWDELFLTMGPLLTSGKGITIVNGDQLQQPSMLELISILEFNSYLFLRYAVKPSQQQSGP